MAHTFLTHGRRPPMKVAGMLLCAILSDTLNLLGPTTTDWDRLMVAVLSDLCGVDDIQLLGTSKTLIKSQFVSVVMKTTDNMSNPFSACSWTYHLYFTHSISAI